MRFHVDLHIHSKYSRATSRDLDLEHLAYWAGRKGVSVVGTGDFTHPAWRAEIKEKLVPAPGEDGLFRLRPDLEASLNLAPMAVPRFLLSVEISTIYKKGERTRKIHHLIYAPDFDTADRISAALARIGNIASDGRPILGLDSRHLLEITLESHPDAYLVPAHIWTPWFAVLGSQSGFDSIVECYGDLSDHIFAVETGLSSDPPMNWRLSMLDRYRLVSNSDAHSPGKLGREATTLECAMSYVAIRDALRTGNGYVGTIEFFPEEGKYHLDGHRKCGVRLTPEETAAMGSTRCPACGGAMTIGVASRAASLADRDEQAPPPATAGEVSNLVPLCEVLSEIASSGPASKQVERRYDRLVSTLGSELWILEEAPIEDIARAESSLLAEAITRLRAGNVIREAGYDGEYGVIRLFEDSELKRLSNGGGVLFDTHISQRAAVAIAPAPSPRPLSKAKVMAAEAPLWALASESESESELEPTPARVDVLRGLDDDQRRAAEVVHGPLLIIAGPGSGKTRTLTRRIAHLIADCGVPATACLAITFTRRAASEMRERLAQLLPGAADQIPIHTFHSLGLAILREHGDAAGLPRGLRVASEAERIEALSQALDVPTRKAESLLRAISKAKRTAADAEALDTYQHALTTRNWIDFDDLVGLAVRALSTDAAVAAAWRDRLRWISVDEFQDVDEQQYRLLALLTSANPNANLCVIGDPNQAIYGFRGADAACFDRFTHDHPQAVTVTLARNYRSTGTIVTASSQLISQPLDAIVRDMHERITIHSASSDRAEAEFVVTTIEQLMGGHSLLSIETGRGGAGHAETALSFADFAVLFRTDAQSEVLLDAFDRSGIPYKKHTHKPLSPAPPPADATASDDLALITEADLWDPRADRVSLLTLHAAKGLEFPIVFIVGLEEGVLPLYWNDLNDEAAAEERRLFYVGMTRAKDRLLISRATQRQWRGRMQTLSASRFLNAIESELTKHQRTPEMRRKPENAQLSLLL